MSARPDPSLAKPGLVPAPVPAPTRTDDPKETSILFRIVAEHQHQAVVDGHTFCCTRQSTKINDQLLIRWSALKDGVPLASDCRTLNEAKNICRSAARKARSEADPAAILPPPRTRP